MRILLLGSNGLLGHNVLLTLLQQGHSVNALLRRVNALHTDGFPNTERLSIFEGSILDYAQLSHAAQGCDAIINCAGVTDMSLLRYEDYLPINRDLCQLLLDVMQEHGIKRLVHTSTANTIGYGSPEQLANENDEMQAPFSRSYYALSKQEGEQILIQAAHKQGAQSHIIIVNPGFMIGAYDTKPSSGTLLLAGFHKPIMAAPKGGKSFVSAADCAKAMVNALTSGESGKRYLLTGENLTLSQFYWLQAHSCGYRQLIMDVPNWILGLAGRAGDILRCCGIRTQVSTRNVRQLMVREYYDHSAASNELQMPSTPIAESITAFFDWYSRK